MEHSAGSLPAAAASAAAIPEAFWNETMLFPNNKTKNTNTLNANLYYNNNPNMQ